MYQQIDDVIRDGQRLNIVDAPLPGLGGGVECEQFLLMERRKEMGDKKRISPRLESNEFRQISDILTILMKCIGDQVRHGFIGERRHVDIPDQAAVFDHSIQGDREGVRFVDFIFPVSPDEQEMMQLAPAHDEFDQFKRRLVHPLQVVQENHERMRLPAENTHEIEENAVKTVLRLVRAEFHEGRLRSCHQFQIGNHIDDGPHMDAQRSQEPFPPLQKPCFTLAQDLIDKVLKRLDETAVRDVMMQLIELAANVIAGFGNEGPVNFLYQGCLADAGITPQP